MTTSQRTSGRRGSAGWMPAVVREEIAAEKAASAPAPGSIRETLERLSEESNECLRVQKVFEILRREKREYKFARLFLGRILHPIRESRGKHVFRVFVETTGIDRRTAFRAVNDRRKELGLVPLGETRKRAKYEQAVTGVHSLLGSCTESDELPSGAAGRGSGEAAGFSRGAEPPLATNRAPRGGEDRYSHDAATRAAVHATAGQSCDDLDKSQAEPVRNVTHGDTKTEFSRGTPWSDGEPGVMSGPETIRPVETKSGDVTAGETATFDSSKHRSRRAVIGGTVTGTAQLHFAELYEAAQAAHALIERLVKSGSLDQIRAMLAVGGVGSQVGGGIPVGAPVAEVAGAVLSPVAAVRTCGSSAAFSLSPPPVAPPTGAAGFSARVSTAPGGGGSERAVDLLSPPRVDGAVGNGRAVI